MAIRLNTIPTLSMYFYEYIIASGIDGIDTEVQQAKVPMTRSRTPMFCCATHYPDHTFKEFSNNTARIIGEEDASRVAVNLHCWVIWIELGKDCRRELSEILWVNHRRAHHTFAKNQLQQWGQGFSKQNQAPFPMVSDGSLNKSHNSALYSITAVFATAITVQQERADYNFHDLKWNERGYQFWICDSWNMLHTFQWTIE